VKAREEEEMTVIKQTDWTTYTGAPEPTMQQLGENPVVYREMLMAADENGTPVPYRVDNIVVPKIFVRVPHGLSTDASVRTAGDPGNPNTVGAGHERIPDVAIPILVDDTGDLLLNAAPFLNVALAFDSANVFSTTGYWADESYIYLSLSTSAPGASAAFLVYVEYTHSVVKNEIVTGEYDTVFGPIP
jgi:hypothetical protein